MSWAEIKKSVNSNVIFPLNEIGLNKVTFTTNSTWTCPDGVNVVYATGIAAGGDGGTAGIFSTNIECGGGGGDRGQFCFRRPIKVTPNQTYSVTVGAGDTVFHTLTLKKGTGGNSGSDGGTGGGNGGGNGARISATGGYYQPATKGKGTNGGNTLIRYSTITGNPIIAFGGGGAGAPEFIGTVITDAKGYGGNTGSSPGIYGAGGGGGAYDGGSGLGTKGSNGVLALEW